MFEKEAEEYVMREDVITENDRVPFDNGYGFQTVSFEDEVKKGFQDGAEFGYNKANEWQTGEPIKGREIFARNIANCNLLATYFDGAWRNVWNGGIIDFDKITMWRYTGFKNNGEKIELP